MEKYDSAAIRHFEDAQLLMAAGKIDNAGHLVGFAAECAIKHQILSLKPGQPNPHGHLPEFLIVARKHLGSRANYNGMFNILKADAFSGWHVNRRYYQTGNTTLTELDAWFDVAKRLFATAGLKVRQ
ncbi:hypothetical protein [Gallionella capsiferriformans]|uniref:HEPN domain-containing protein n=1 Tax=Gallionella capsiferriformans (strain ES-2) TaxID=395494 RepID=D9SG80_GALCS|nr:hypothetical protein [Gallionella capsiferriformans]ADL55527.1 hypothetical protein Galf_1508 [Gallionella capsiferriformans ES-2]